MLATILCLFFPVLLVIAAAHDVRTMKIPNWISIALTLAFIPTAFAAGLSLQQIGIHLGIGMIALIIGAGLFFLGVWGGGDGKLVAATAIWVGAAGGMNFLYGVAMFGGLLALVLIILRRMKIESKTDWIARLLWPKVGAPYGVAIAAGGLWAASASPVFADGFRALGF